MKAFPGPTTYEGRTNEDFASEGMDLRDWFAGQALIALAASGPRGHAPAELVAGAAYQYADAMMKAREA